MKTEAAEGGGAESAEADVVLVCVGRREFADNLGLADAARPARARPPGDRCQAPNSWGVAARFHIACRKCWFEVTGDRT